MQNSAYVGRIGRLAVALGTGAVVVSVWGAGVAWADDSESSASGTASSSTGTGASDQGETSTAKSTTDSPQESATAIDVGGDTSGDPTDETSATDDGDAEDEDAAEDVTDDEGDGLAGKDTEDDENDDDASVDSRDDPSSPTGNDADKPARGPAFAAPQSKVDATAVTALRRDEVASVTTPPVESSKSSAPLVVEVPPPAPAPAAVPTTPPDDTVEAVVDTVSSIVTAIFAPRAASTPQAPAAQPALWSLAAFARRELETPFESPPLVDDPVAVQTTGENFMNTSIPADWESQYVGQPTLIHRLVVAGLHVVDLVLKPFGGLLALTGLKVPLFADGIPPFFLTHGLDVQRNEFEGMSVWSLEPADPTGEYIVALHGGAYVAEASIFHWWTYTDMARDTDATVVVPDYPLVNEGGTATVVVPQTADLIAALIAEHSAENVSVIGDSAGGGLALAAVQELVRRDSPVPARMVLLAPWLDVAVSDPLSQAIDPRDPLLDIPNLQDAGRKWAGDSGPNDALASPLHGSLDGLPPIAVYSGSLDLLTPDALRLQQRVAAEGYGNFTFVLRKDRLHDWPIFGFLPEAHAVRPSIYQALLGG